MDAPRSTQSSAENPVEKAKALLAEMKEGGQQDLKTKLARHDELLKNAKDLDKEIAALEQYVNQAAEIVAGSLPDMREQNEAAYNGIVALRDASKAKLLATLGEAGDLVKNNVAVHGALYDEAKAIDEKEYPAEKAWLGKFKTRFNSLSALHPGVEWADVEKSLQADPDSMRKVEALDAKGHAMNVFGEEDGSFVFVSGWNDYKKVSSDHRTICYDAEGQKLAKEAGYNPNGNAVDIAASMGVDLADTKYHEQLIGVAGANGWAWLKTDAKTRKTGVAFYGDNNGFSRGDAGYHNDGGSFRAALRVKKA